MKRSNVTWFPTGTSRTCLLCQTTFLLDKNLLLCISLFWSLVSVCPGMSHPSQRQNQSALLMHPNANQLCAHAFDGDEGTSIKGFILDRVFIATTTGITFRNSTDSMVNKGGSNSHCHFQEFSSSHRSDKVRAFTEALELKQLLKSKSKPASAFKAFADVPKSCSCKENMLTSQGIAQGIQLGGYLAKSYLNRLKSLSPLTKEWAQFAHSVGDELLYQSVQSVLYGLLSEKQFVYAVIGILSSHYTDDSKICPKIKEDIDYFVKTAFKNEHYLFKDISSPTSLRYNVDNEFGEGISAKDIMSSVSLHHCDNAVTDGIKLSHDLIDSVVMSSGTHNQYLINSTFFLNYSKSLTLPFRKFIQTWILSLQKNNMDLKLVSVDEMFMLSLISAFDLEEIGHIPPVSRLVVERFFKKTSSYVWQSSFESARQKYQHAPVTPPGENPPRQREEKSQATRNTVHGEQTYFRVLFNGRVVTNEIWNCGSDAFARQGLCSLPNFAAGLESEVKLKSHVSRLP